MEKARSILKQPTDVTLDEFVPGRFFCTGGTVKKKGTISCKGLDYCVKMFFFTTMKLI